MVRTCEVHHPKTISVVLVAVVLTVGAFVSVSGLDTHVRFLLSEPTGYITAAAEDDEVDLILNQEDADFLSRVSSGSLGYRYFAHERMFCMEVSNGRVVDVRLVDVIEESDFHEISGGCTREYGVTSDVGLIHTHPRYNQQLSETDKEISNPPFSVTCLVYDSVVESRGTVYGLRCFEVPSEQEGSERDFEELKLAIE